jgi:hypothetical protein
VLSARDGSSAAHHGDGPSGGFPAAMSEFGVLERAVVGAGPLDERRERTLGWSPETSPGPTSTGTGSPVRREASMTDEPLFDRAVGGDPLARADDEQGRP